MRTFALFVALLGVAGCGDDTTMAASGPDMSVHVDLSGQSVSCGATGVAQSCANASLNNACFVCDLSGGGGVCARVCSLLTQSCPTGQTCREFTFGDAGANSGIAVEGSGCGGFGYCH